MRAPFFVLFLVAILLAPTAHAQEAPPAPPQPALSALEQAQATIIKLQAALLEKDRENARLRLDLADAKQDTLQATANALAVGFLKTLGAKPTDTFDWATLTARPAVGPTPTK